MKLENGTQRAADIVHDAKAKVVNPSRLPAPESKPALAATHNEGSAFGLETPAENDSAHSGAGATLAIHASQIDVLGIEPGPNLARCRVIDPADAAGKISGRSRIDSK